ncbi:hypothetical protein ACG04R_16450 [Roseateles sp. BYS78W]|uniref:Uncharacterized protein n=1 Tax=Pelomonas candidula TaxID=3299025 RepID=A0ABW7HEE4_9BURK
MTQIRTIGAAVEAVKSALDSDGGAIGDQADELKDIAHQVLERVPQEVYERVLDPQMAHDIQVFMDAAKRRPAGAAQTLVKVASILEGAARA